MDTEVVKMSGSPEELEVLEGELYEFLPTLEVEELETVFDKLGETCPVLAKGKKHILLRLIYKILDVASATDDGGFATIKIIHDYVTSISKVVKDDPDPAKQDEVEELKLFEAKLDSLIKSGKGKETGEKVTRIEKLQTLKINGTIGGERDNMTFTDLYFQPADSHEQ